MLEIKGLGRFENAPQIAVDIAAGNVDALDGHLRKKWNIDKKIKTGEHSQYTPISIALIANSFASVKWLVEHGVNLNQKYDHSFLVAVRYCDENIIRYIVEHGAKVIGDDPNTDAFEQALFGEKIENLPLREH